MEQALVNQSLSIFSSHFDCIFQAKRQDASSHIPAEFQTISSIQKKPNPVNKENQGSKGEPVSPEYTTDRGEGLNRLKVLAAQAKFKSQTSSSLNSRQKPQKSQQQIIKPTAKNPISNNKNVGAQESDTGKMSAIQDQYYSQRQGNVSARNQSDQRGSSGSKVSVITRLIANKTCEQASPVKQYNYNKNAGNLTNNTLNSNASQASSSSNPQDNNNNNTNTNASPTLRRSQISFHNYVRQEMPPSTIKHRPTSRNGSLRMSSAGRKSSSARELDVNVNKLLDQYKQLVQKKCSKQQHQEEEYQQSKRVEQPTSFRNNSQSKPQIEGNYYNSNKYEDNQGNIFSDSNNPKIASVVSATSKLLKIKSIAELSDYQFEKTLNPPLVIATPSNFKTKQNEPKKESLQKEFVKEQNNSIKKNNLQGQSRISLAIISNPASSATTPNNLKTNQLLSEDLKLNINLISQNKLSQTRDLAKTGTETTATPISSVNISSSYFGSFLSKQLGLGSNISSSMSPQESCSTERASVYDETSFINQITKQTPSIDDFVFQKVLGKGSYAVVRSASHKKTGFLVAIKSYDKSKFTDSQRKQNVEREIEILSHVNHKHIIKLYKSIDDKECVNLVMEYTPCASLSNYLKSKQNKRMHEFEAKTIFKQLVEAVVYLHSKKIIHRDIKLENILIDSDRQIKLIDFGFSVIVAPPYRLSMFCGTPSYMAPEIVTKVGYSFEVDTWALGVLLFKLLTGCFPFVGEDDKTLYKNIARCKYDIPPYISIQGKILLSFLMKENPKERMQLKDVLNNEWFEMK